MTGVRETAYRDALRRAGIEPARSWIVRARQYTAAAGERAGGTLLDRSVFSVLNLVSGDSVTSTYELTCSAGG